jgi:hypothetical protein
VELKGVVINSDKDDMDGILGAKLRSKGCLPFTGNV